MALILVERVSGGKSLGFLFWILVLLLTWEENFLLSAKCGEMWLPEQEQTQALPAIALKFIEKLSNFTFFVSLLSVEYYLSEVFVSSC